MLSSAQLVETLRHHQLLEPSQLKELETLPAHVGGAESYAAELCRRGWLTAFQVRHLLEGEADKLVLGAYVLMDRLGEGGMGQVFKARHVLMKRIVALKVIRDDRLDKPDAVERFRREIHALAQLRHPNVVIAHDAAMVNHTLFLVMEYLEGTDLYRLVRERGPLPVGTASAYIREAACGLQHIHEHGLVHRDMKPGNLFLAQADDRVKILDLGLARLARYDQQREESAVLTESRFRVGTPAYAAPEQVVDSHDVDIRADIYGLGGCFYYLLTGTPPFTRSSLGRTGLSWEAPPPAELLRPDLPADLLACLRRMMAFRPEDRFAAPREVADVLAVWSDRKSGSVGGDTPLDEGAIVTRAFAPPVAHDPTPASPDATTRAETPPTTRPAGWLMTSRQRLLCLLAFAFVGLFLFREIWYGAGDAPRPAPAPPQPQTLLEPKRVPPGKPGGEIHCLAAHTDWVSSVTFFPEGPRALSGGAETLWVWDLANGQKIGSLGIGLKTACVAVSPDGRLVLMGTQVEGAYLGVVEVEANRFRSLAAPHSNTVKVVQFAADGRHALSASEKVLCLWTVAGAELKAGGEKKGDAIRGASFLPGAKRMLWGDWNRTTKALQVHSWDVLSDQAQVIGKEHFENVTALAFSHKGEFALVGEATGTLWLWDLSRAQPPRRMPGHTSKIWSLAISKDDRLALSGAGARPQGKPEDCTVRLWDLPTGKERACFERHTRPVWSVAFSPDGCRALSGGEDGSVRYWQLPE